MPPANTARDVEPTSPAPNGGASAFQKRASRGHAPALHGLTTVPSAPKPNAFHFQVRTPVLIGEATYRGWLPVDGLISGQLNGNGGALSVKQRTRNANSTSTPELSGEIYFKDMVRINGHVEGRVSSDRGTLIVDESAVVDALIEVGIAVIYGTVHGDVIGHERVELGPCAVIDGNIFSPALTIKPGAVFHGQCHMARGGNGNHQ